MITATNKATGEVIELPSSTLEEIVAAWRVAREYAKAADSLKDQLKKLVPEHVGTVGTSSVVGNYMFRVSYIQRMTYDKSVMRTVLDPDVFDVLLKPDKTSIDKYLKENLESLGEASTLLRQSMIEDGKGYQVVKLEKVKGE